MPPKILDDSDMSPEHAQEILTFLTRGKKPRPSKYRRQYLQTFKCPNPKCRFVWYYRTERCPVCGVPLKTINTTPTHIGMVKKK